MAEKPKLIICGHARHGKDTVAGIVQKSFGFTFESSSHIAMRCFLRRQLAYYYGLVYSSDQECYLDRVNHREKWFDLIRLYNTPDKSKLAELIFRDNDIYVGIRSVEELDETRRNGVFDLAIWVDASNRVPPEPKTSNTITEDDCDFSIANNFGFTELEQKVKRIFKHIC